jgi:AcrR family transcriptional regulator
MARRRKALTTRERLVRAATRVIARDGFQKASLANVAREAGVTTGAVYSNFASKEDLFIATLSSLRPLNGIDAASEPSGADGELGDRAHEVVRAWRAAFARSGVSPALVLEIQLLGMRDRRARRLVAGSMEECRRYLAAMLRRQADELDADLPESPEALGAILFGALSGLALQRWFDGDAIPEEYFEIALKRLLTPCRCGQESESDTQS